MPVAPSCILAGMPELPEVETVVRELRAKLPGAVITRAVVTAPDMYRRDSRDVSTLEGARVTGLERLGKAIVIRCESDRGRLDLAVHLGMTGQLLWTARAQEPALPHLHARWGLSGGAELRLVDPRRFGYVLVGAPETVRASLAIGPDALSITPEELALALRGRRAAIKALLLDQRIVAGLGNIYVDETLFLARVHPSTGGDRAATRAREILSAARRVLARAIDARGTTLRDYRRPDGSTGEFQMKLRVYGREGESCPRCRARIRRIEVGQRGTHFCPRCQRAPRRVSASPRR
ncbi:MAG TPA: bifunctional DNA-formamidopyrimidine glycosylase/DNA-(apurinic or apyrimidinic site) lyase [Candidatus Krumholzibacteria bacterium]|nr:bifunctional DNA-formamidopyrimidine glycosylase/DNA-(apurinic or apyrimidinic site) lyase [Candidatus Krumholzibacteria bacterium]